MKPIMIAQVKYRDPLGGWHPVGKIGVRIEGHLNAHVYMNAVYLGHCYAFPFDGVEEKMPYLHGTIVGHDGYYYKGDKQQSRWIECGYIWTDEKDGSDWNGEELYGRRMYGLRFDAMPVRLVANNKGAIVLPIRDIEN